MGAIAPGDPPNLLTVAYMAARREAFHAGE